VKEGGVDPWDVQKVGDMGREGISFTESPGKGVSSKVRGLPVDDHGRGRKEVTMR